MSSDQSVDVISGTEDGVKKFDDVRAVVEHLRLLDARFREADEPTLVLVARRGGLTSLLVGLGGEESMLSWLRYVGPFEDIVNQDPVEDLVSQGAHGDSASSVEFCFNDEASVYSGTVLVPIEDALSAVHEYVESGRRPGGVEWKVA